MQVILRAGATKTAGLKSIMARHLAFASQALGAIISLIPYIREYTRRHLGNANPSIAEFDRTKRVCLQTMALTIIGSPNASR
jgi:vacuolar protein sorting-associated protein 54